MEQRFSMNRETAVFKASGRHFRVEGETIPHWTTLGMFRLKLQVRNKVFLLRRKPFLLFFPLDSESDSNHRVFSEKSSHLPGTCELAGVTGPP